MPIHTAAQALSSASTNQLLLSVAVVILLYGIKLWSGGKKCTWERDWAGKMILVVASPTPTILALMDHLLHLPTPPQILFLPPLSSPLPEELLTVLHTMRLGISNPLGQLHCEGLPSTPSGVRDFIRKWGNVQQGTAGEDGRRVDAIILGDGWEIAPPAYSNTISSANGSTGAEKKWTIHQFQFHFLTGLLPYLLRAPAERNIRIILLVSPVWSAALPTLEGKPVREGLVQESARRGITTLLLMKHFQLILDTLASASYSKKEKVVPDPDDPEKMVRERNKTIKSNVMGVSVIMPMARSEVVRGFLGVQEALWKKILYMISYPLLLFVTPSSSKSIQSILFALSAPIRYGDLPDPTLPSPTTTDREIGDDPRAGGVSGGDVIRDCRLFDLPPVLQDPGLAKANYDAVEKEVEGRLKSG